MNVDDKRIIETKITVSELREAVAKYLNMNEVYFIGCEPIFAKDTLVRGTK